MALAYKTGGQYTPLGGAKLLTKIIIGGAKEEISLQPGQSPPPEAMQLSNQVFIVETDDVKS
jgi:hypothetical protein